jgi:hypothetical protein
MIVATADWSIFRLTIHLLRLFVAAGAFAILSLSTTSLAQSVQSAQSMHWDFGTEDSTAPRLVPHGDVERDQAGPRPPEFPDFGEDNLAVRFGGDGARLMVDDGGGESVFDFTNGQALTLEAWVNVSEIDSGKHAYVIGKGRTHADGFDRENHNWALRLTESDGEAKASFLFATPKSAGGQPWHRWMSDAGFVPGNGWHHVAVSYVFGEPASIVGWIDGERTNGTWDLGGATDKAPVVDDAAVWIGSSMGGSSSNSLAGLLDEVAVHRRVLPEDEMKARFHREGQPRESEQPEQATPILANVEIPHGSVLVTFEESFLSHAKWPRAIEGNLISHALLSSFYLHRMPFRYDDWGIRDSWKPTAMATMAADVSLTPGQHHAILRVRGLSRLWVDDALILTTSPHSGSTDGHGPVLPLPEPPAPGLEPVAYGDHEYEVQFNVSGSGTARIILESLIGGKALRVEPGEMMLAIKIGQSFHLLTPYGFGPEITAAEMDNIRNESETALALIDDSKRRKASASQDAFWERRHALARDYALALDTKRDAHSIDRFLEEKIAEAKIAALQSESSDPAMAKHFHQRILPLLHTQCFRCHGESKHKGDLRLDSRAAAVEVIVPGDPAASELIARITSDDPDERMPPMSHADTDTGLTPEDISLLCEWIAGGVPWPAPPLPKDLLHPAPILDDAAFLRRVYLDTIGIPPSAEEARTFLADGNPDKRTHLVSRMLGGERFADHWVSYWQDILAENPNILKPSLNNTGPFRFFLHEALRDNKALDRMVTELILLRGSEREGGAAGFGMAADNDSPLAAKAHVLGNAFLGVEMQCARCHDSPYHSTTQRDLYAIAGMLNRSAMSVPKSSTVPAGFFEKNKGRESLIKVTLPPGEPVTPEWPFAGVTGIQDSAALDALAFTPGDSRDRLAALVTAPQNRRFARVMVNRLWRRLIGAGIVEPAHDWEGKAASHPELLDWLAAELMTHDYDQKHILRLIMTSELYARSAVGSNLEATAERRFFAAPERRRMTAEQVVDSLFATSGQHMEVEELTFDPDGRRPATTMISLERPARAWEFTSLSNERDRPSLALPRAQAVIDVLEAFGWIAARQSPVNQREISPNVLQPGMLANSTLSTWITRASDGSPLAGLALHAPSVEALIDGLFLRLLTRMPRGDERDQARQLLQHGFSDREVPADQVRPNIPPEPLQRVSWTNHLHPDANSLKLVMEQRAHAGTPPDPRLRPDWRERYEDLIWSLINSPEFVWIP